MFWVSPPIRTCKPVKIILRLACRKYLATARTLGEFSKHFYSEQKLIQYYYSTAAPILLLIHKKSIDGVCMNTYCMKDCLLTDMVGVLGPTISRSYIIMNERRRTDVIVPQSQFHRALQQAARSQRWDYLGILRKPDQMQEERCRRETHHDDQHRVYCTSCNDNCRLCEDFRETAVHLGGPSNRAHHLREY